MKIDKSYKKRPEVEEEAYYGCDHKQSYIDEPLSIVCISGWMIDVDTYTEGWHDYDFKYPCKKCNPIAFKEYLDEEIKAIR